MDGMECDVHPGNIPALSCELLCVLYSCTFSFLTGGYVPYHCNISNLSAAYGGLQFIYTQLTIYLCSSKLPIL